ncbi:hypothetical protein [Bifidobacterium moukalabense]|uniref:hypothetical protein n=1 Tax=Bifidobacterium moukalabense TaxID=1333651 RepID=UPI0010F7BAB3|nr:hypothetical protein [Bifidobacterium moukalabense]
MTLHLSETDLHPMGLLDLQTPLIAVLAICLVLATVLVTVAIWLSRPGGRPVRQRSYGRHEALTDKALWRKRIDEIVARHDEGEISREDAFAELATLARDYVSTVTGTDIRNRTLADINAIPRTTGNQDGITLLRQTIEALYPPEFADAANNGLARETTVEQAGEWVANLVERWR